MSNNFQRLPDEIFIHIYKYINPISKINNIKNEYWCYRCGEYIYPESLCVKTLNMYSCIQCFNLYK